jgi:hypothetical protein
MGYYDKDVYHQPEEFGLQILASIDWSDGDYCYDYTVIWRGTDDGTLYYGSNAGCSCPSPFEKFTSRDKLTPLTDFAAFEKEMKEREEAVMGEKWRNTPHVPGAVVDLLWKVRQALRVAG